MLTISLTIIVTLGYGKSIRTITELVPMTVEVPMAAVPGTLMEISPGTPTATGQGMPMGTGRCRPMARE
jgi:hypothetical protein